MNTTAPDVIIHCICDCFQKDEIEEIENSLVPYNLHLKIEQDSKPQFLNSPFEWFFPVLQILLAPETQTALCQGLASSACYDGIIYLCRLIWKRFHHHPFYKIQDGKIEKSPANIQFVIDNNRLILPVDVDKDKYEYAVDRFMEKAFASNPDERTFFYYSDDQQTILCKTESRIIKDEIEKRQNKS